MGLQLQLEFDFTNKDKKRLTVDYDYLFKVLQKRGPMKTSEIAALMGTPTHLQTEQIIKNLTLRYPIWSPKYGVWKVLEESDYCSTQKEIEERYGK